MSTEEPTQPSPMDTATTTTTTSSSSSSSTAPPPQPSAQQDASQPTSQPETYRQVAAAHIATLSEINHQLPKMLRYFATALTQLTDHPIHDTHNTNNNDNNTNTQPTDTLESRREAFRKYATFTGMSVNLIREELVRQIEDLEAYKVIPTSHPKFTVAKRHGDTAPSKEETDPQAGVRNGGYGDFDVGVLNARASTGLGGEDVLERVRGVLEELARRSGGNEGVDGVKDEQMVGVDG
ncbi:hypothetical protein IAQ61_010209 [Plenodomus lingam]|uniref:Mediator of RNA polymerase II transcription subunit 11 n=1 Tax=Leptosphaeria maculans (strain JN3 / isolate v23.1.3 / race Av1-4-5-6-7-8) TaxID=985895 RepID=E5A391_LEPMJ|nr:hypothetical protein LEMA_P095130.1 [Plenodomus lingam JN3]KAH9862008.1 hypothetical protein IAQ61_010209 [Plenodomus lingam]CBX98104.1 hypothetical protein LEMA_P095130.1 [Plenodomus lingam JN3]